MMSLLRQYYVTFSTSLDNIGSGMAQLNIKADSNSIYMIFI